VNLIREGVYKAIVFDEPAKYSKLNVSVPLGILINSNKIGVNFNGWLIGRKQPIFYKFGGAGL